MSSHMGGGWSAPVSQNVTWGSGAGSKIGQKVLRILFEWLQRLFANF